jgi:hypothetical protein
METRRRVHHKKVMTRNRTEKNLRALTLHRLYGETYMMHKSILDILSCLFIEGVTHSWVIRVQESSLTWWQQVCSLSRLIVSIIVGTG